MTVKESIEKILREAKRPLTVREITARVLGRGLWSTSGVTPEATVSAQLSTSVKKGENRFVRTGPGEYAVYGLSVKVKNGKPKASLAKTAVHSARKTQLRGGDSGYVYILTNPSFRKDWVKIGMTERPVNIRSKELDNTAVPLPFDIYATLKTEHRRKVENLLHGMIDDFDPNRRIRKSREFFNINPETALRLLVRAAEVFDEEENISREFNKPVVERKDIHSKERRKALTQKHKKSAISGETWESKTQLARIIARRAGNEGAKDGVAQYFAPVTSKVRKPCHPDSKWRKPLEDAGVKFDNNDYVIDWQCAKNPL